MNKAQQLHQDIVHDAPITGSQTLLDTRTIEFYNESRDGKPMAVVGYKIVDGALRIWLEDRNFDDNKTQPAMEAAAAL